MNDDTATDPGTVSCDEVAVADLSLDDQLHFRIYEDFLNGRLRVPMMPDIAIRIRRAVSDPDANATQIVKIVQTDPPLSAYLIRVANSPLYNTGRKIQDLKSVVARLGLTAIRDLVMSFTLKNLFTGGSPVLKRRMTDVWMHSCAVSAFSFIIARETRAVNPDRALLAGLLHDIGDAVILTHAGEYPDLIRDAARLDEAVGKLRGPIGAMVLTHWKLDDDFVQVASAAEDWYRNTGAAADLCDVVLIAQILLHQSSDDGRCLPAVESIPAFLKLRATHSAAEFSSKIIDGAREELQAIQTLLHA